MKSIELKLKGIDGKFPAAYTKKVIEILGNPKVSAEVDEGKPSEDVLRALQSLGYSVETRKLMDGSVTLRAGREEQ